MAARAARALPVWTWEKRAFILPILIESLALNDVKARVEQALRGLAEKEGGEPVIPTCVTHRDIAAMVGASREVVTRIFRSLEETGVVRVAGRRITLTVSRPRN